MQIVRDITNLSDPIGQIITLAEAKNYLRVDYSEDDDLINSLILSAQKRLEQYAGIAFNQRTLQTIAYVDNFIELPYAPISTVLSVEVFMGNDWVELTQGGDYYLVGNTYTKVYFTSYLCSEFRFTYLCGFECLPDSIKVANLKLISDLYEYRESSVESTKPSANLTTAYELMKPYKRVSIIL
jgi:uncharacterized phiE125 gp8 family phage protein